METKPAYFTRPAQYHVLYEGTCIESTGYLPSLAAAKAFARRRYSETNGLAVRAAYPPNVCDGVAHPVAE